MKKLLPILLAAFVLIPVARAADEPVELSWVENWVRDVERMRNHICLKVPYKDPQLPTQCMRDFAKAIGHIYDLDAVVLSTEIAILHGSDGEQKRTSDMTRTHPVHDVIGTTVIKYEALLLEEHRIYTRVYADKTPVLIPPFRPESK